LECPEQAAHRYSAGIGGSKVVVGSGMILDIIGIGAKLIDKVIPDPQAAADAKLKLMELEQQGALTELAAGRDVIVAEAQSEHPLTSQWRPITMLIFAAIVANNYLLYPYLSLFWQEAPVLEMPEQLWSLLTVGIGGYIGGRSLEKFAKEWKS
jgi:hypothetical protein